MLYPSEGAPMIRCTSLKNVEFHAGPVYSVARNISGFKSLSFFQPSAADLHNLAYGVYTPERFVELCAIHIRQNTAAREWVFGLTDKTVTLVCVCPLERRRHGQCHLTAVADFIREWRPDLLVVLDSDPVQKEPQDAWWTEY